MRGNDPEQCGLARAGQSDHGRDLSRPDKERHPGEGWRRHARVSMGDLVEKDVHHATRWRRNPIAPFPARRSGDRAEQNREVLTVHARRGRRRGREPGCWIVRPTTFTPCRVGDCAHSINTNGIAGTQRVVVTVTVESSPWIPVAAVEPRSGVDPSRRSDHARSRECRSGRRAHRRVVRSPPRPYRHRRPSWPRATRHRGSRRWCADAGRPTRFKPSSPSPTDAVRDGSAKLGHPVQNVTREHGLTPLPR